MNLNLQRGAGRGEYELAGRQGDLRPQDLFDLPIFIESLPGTSFNAYSKCLKKDGKPRIRLTPELRHAHPSSLISNALMLPRPRRERDKTHGTNLLRWEKFVVQNIRIDIAAHAGRVVMSPLIVRLENGDGVRLDINFAERMARVVRLWNAAVNAVGVVADAVRAHHAAFTSEATAQSELVGSLAALRSSLDKPDGDMLPLLEAHFGLAEPGGAYADRMSAEAGDDDFDEEVYTEPAQARIKRARQWRLAAVRGKSAADFRRNVQEAYDYRCLFSAHRLPRTGMTTTPGVDAAHILPWSQFDLDTLRNGLCLSKQCHWAFDEGLLRLAFDDDVNSYVVSIPDPIRLAAKAADLDLDSFVALARPIPATRLPKNEDRWPSKEYLSAWNRYLDGGPV